MCACRQASGNRSWHWPRPKCGSGARRAPQPKGLSAAHDADKAGAQPPTGRALCGDGRRHKCDRAPGGYAPVSRSRREAEAFVEAAKCFGVTRQGSVRVDLGSHSHHVNMSSHGSSAKQNPLQGYPCPLPSSVAHYFLSFPPSPTKSRKEKTHPITGMRRLRRHSISPVVLPFLFIVSIALLSGVKASCVSQGGVRVGILTQEPESQTTGERRVCLQS